MKKRIRIFKNIDDMTFNCDSNIIFITGLSGSGKSFLSRKISEEKNQT